MGWKHMWGWILIPGPASLLASHHVVIDPGRDVSCQRYLGVDKEWIFRLLSVRLVDFPIAASPRTDVGEAHGYRSTSKFICYGDAIFDYTGSDEIGQGNNKKRKHRVCTTT